MQELRQFLRKRAMTQEDFAERVGVTQGMVSLWLSGKKRPSLDNLIELSRVTGISVDKLIADITSAEDAETRARA